MQPIQTAIWKHFGSSIDMLGLAIGMVPAEAWAADKRLFYLSYHSLLFLDYYLTVPPTHFSPGLPFTLVPSAEMPAEALDDLVPDAHYSQAECLAWLHTSRDKCRSLLTRLHDEDLSQCWITQPDDIAPPCTLHFSVLEILLYNLRHVQHHVAQLNLLLRQMGLTPPDWVPEADIDELAPPRFDLTRPLKRKPAMPNPATSLRPFLGAQDYASSRRFYRALGFEETELFPNMCLFEVNENLAFYLQDAYVKDWVDNTMVFLEVPDVGAYQAQLAALRLPEQFAGVRLSAVRVEDWGKVCFLHDPAGILWQIGQFT